MNPISFAGTSAIDTLQTKSARTTRDGNSTPPEQPGDTAQISAAARQLAEVGRVFLNTKAGNITTDDASGLYNQISSIHQQIQTAKEANGGQLSAEDAEAIGQMQDQLSADIYSAAHDGAAPPAPPEGDAAKGMARVALQAGRVAVQAKAGAIDSDEASQLFGQISGSLDQIKSGDLSGLKELQDSISQQIYKSAH